MFGPGNLRSPLGRARGLGSAKDGLHHWWAQRVTAVALIPLTMWFVASLIGLAGSGYAEFAYWFGRPVNATFMVLFLGVTFHHAQLGLQVVIEDYVSHHGWRIGGIMAAKLVCFALAALSIVSVLAVAFKG